MVQQLASFSMSSERQQARGHSLKVNTTRTDDVESITSPAISARPAVLKLTLQQAWAQAKLQFRQDTGLELDRPNVGGKAGVLQKWKQVYEGGDAEDRRRHDEMSTIFDRILSGIELVAAFAAQVASTAFPPSGVCFNALSFMLDAPRQLKKVYEGIKDLFTEVQNFLVNFRIYQRIDDQFGLDEDLVLNTNMLLIAFVRICGLAHKLLNGGTWMAIKTASKVFFFREDSGVSAQLAEFQRLVQDQTKLTGTVTLEHVLRSEASINEVLKNVTGVQDDVKLILAATNDEKTRFVNKERLVSIEAKLFARPPPAKDLTLIGAAVEGLLPNTFASVAATEMYQQWIDPSVSSPKILSIYGSTGCGKSCMLEAIKNELDQVRATADADASSIYVAVFDFSDRSIATAANKKESSVLSYALKIAALQVARQSTAYAKALSLQLASESKEDKLQNEEDIEQVWKRLRLSTFTATRPSTLYLVFDALRDDEVRRVVDLVAAERSKISLPPDHLPKLRLLITTHDQIVLSEACFLSVSAKTISDKLIRSFARNEMKRLNIFQGIDRDIRRFNHEVLMKATRSTVELNFDKVRKNLVNFSDAIARGERDDVASKLFEESGQENGEEIEEGRVILQDLEKTLSQGDIALLNSILMWLTGSPWKCHDLHVLKAALRLEGANLPIGPLDKKIDDKFSGAIKWHDRGTKDTVSMHRPVEVYLLEAQEASVATAGSGYESLISLDISIRNVTETTIKKFVWDLNETMAAGKFDFGTKKAQGQTLGLNKLLSQLTMTRLCFKLVNEGWSSDTQAMLAYSCIEFPRHLNFLKEMQRSIVPSDRRMILEGLIGFLNDPLQFELRHENYREGFWMYDQEKLDAIKFWLEDKRAIAQLPVKERRWLEKVSTRGEFGFISDQALSVGRRWLTDWRCDSRMLLVWLSNYLYVTGLEGTSSELSEKMPSSKDGSSGSENTLSINGKGVESEASLVAENAIVMGESGETSPSGELTENSHRDSKSDVCQDVQTTAASGVGDEIGDIEEVQKENEKWDYDRILRIVAWVKRSFSIQPDPVFHLTLGNTCQGNGQPYHGIEHYRKVEGCADLEAYAFYGLALCYRSLEKYEDCIKLAAQSLLSFQRETESSELDDFDRAYIVERLNRLEEILSDETKYRPGNFRSQSLHSDSLMLQIHELIYRLQPDPLQCWKVIGLRCESEESEESACQLLEEWLTDEERFSGQSPALSMLEMSESEDLYETLLAMVGQTHNSKLRKMIVEIAADAIELAGKPSTNFVQSRLALLQARASADSSIEARANANHYWERVIAMFPRGVDPDSSEAHILRQGLYNTSMHKFNVSRASLLSNPNMAPQAKAEMLQDLKTHFERVSLDHSLVVSSLPERYSPEPFIIVLASLCGMLQDARQLLRLTMSQTLAILSDEDPENDSAGFESLFRIFCRLGDDVGALTAFAMLDKCEPSGNEHGWQVECDECFEVLHSSDTGGIWLCRFCPKSILCTSCWEKHKRGLLPIHQIWCTVDHASSYLHLVLPQDSQAEPGSSKVLVEWKLEKDSDGRVHRRGGHLLELSEWVAELREIWNIPMLDNDIGRPQK